MALKRRYSTVKVERTGRIAWITFNRPAKRNAMNPQLHFDMEHVLMELETDASVDVLVLTGAGDAWSAGMELKEYFREVDGKSDIAQERIRRDASQWQWRMLRFYNKPTIAMVNGWCFGGAFSIVAGCDIAVAADEAVFGLSEVNFGHFPAGETTPILANYLQAKHGLYYALSGKMMNGREAERIG